MKRLARMAGDCLRIPLSHRNEQPYPNSILTHEAMQGNSHGREGQKIKAALGGLLNHHDLLPP